MEPIIHDEKSHKFFCMVEGFECVAQYSYADGALNFFHTYVPPALRGQGIAAKLLEEAVKFVKSKNLKVIPSCSYAEKFFNEKYPELIAKR